MIKVGNDHVLYHNLDADESPTYVEICFVGDVTVDINVNDAEVDLRCSTWLLNLPSKLSGSFSIAMASKPGDPLFDVHRAAAFNRTPIQMISANGDIEDGDTEYFKAYAHYSAWPWAQPTQEMANHDATMSLSYVEDDTDQVIEPSWGTVAGS